MQTCGCGDSTFGINPGNGVDEQSNMSGIATWDNGYTGSQPSQDISGNAPYRIGGVSFCRKCFLTWAIVFVVLLAAFVGFTRR